jgi:hypothetical protein
VTAHKRHNQLAHDFVFRVLRETATEAECMVVLETILLAAMLFHRPDPLQAAEFLDTMTMHVIERMPAAP